MKYLIRLSSFNKLDSAPNGYLPTQMGSRYHNSQKKYFSFSAAGAYLVLRSTIMKRWIRERDRVISCTDQEAEFGVSTFLYPHCQFCFNNRTEQSITSSLPQSIRVQLTHVKSTKHTSIFKTSCTSIMSSAHQSISIPSSTITNNTIYKIQAEVRPSVV